MSIKRIIPQLIAVGAIVGGALIPMTAQAASFGDDHRRSDKDTWTGLAVLGGLVGAAGVANHDGTVAAVGFGGALYSLIRGNHDRDCRHSIEVRREPEHVRVFIRDRDHRFDRWRGR